MDIIQAVEKDIMPVDRTINFTIGDTVKVHYKIIEGDRERIQIFEGIVISIDNKGMGKSFTVRKLSFDVGVERIFPFYSTKIAKIEIVRSGKVRRAKLFYLRDRKGKSAKLKERRDKSAAKTSAKKDTKTETKETAAAEPAANEEGSE